MTYQRNITPSLLEEDVLHEAPEDLVGGVEVDADDEAGDEDDGGALDDLRLARPLHLLQLAPRLLDEALAASTGERAAPALTLDGLRGRADLRLARAGALRDRAALRLGLAARTALRTSLPSQRLAGLPVHGVSGAPAAVILDLEAVGRVALRLRRHVVASLALVAGERELVSDSCLGHGDSSSSGALRDWSRYVEPVEDTGRTDRGRCAQPNC